MSELFIFTHFGSLLALWLWLAVACFRLSDCYSLRWLATCILLSSNVLANGLLTLSRFEGHLLLPLCGFILAGVHLSIRILSSWIREFELTLILFSLRFYRLFACHVVLPISLSLWFASPAECVCSPSQKPLLAGDLTKYSDV